MVVRDSAGITIVENRTALWSNDSTWHVSKEPTVRIGTADGQPEAQLYSVVGATRLPYGQIVIANAGTNTIRFYDGRGQYVREVGGRGEGPGEFVGLTWLRRFGGDSLLAFDARLHRLSVFDTAGRFIRAFRLKRTIAFPEFPLAGGRLVGSTRDLVPRRQLQTGVNRDSTTVLQFSMEGVLVDTIGRFPTPETYLWVEGSHITVVPYPFARRIVSAAFGTGFYFGASDVYEIRAYGADGAVQRIVRRKDAGRSVMDADLDRFHQAAFADARDANHLRQLRRAFDAMSVRPTLPAFVALVVDAEGFVWVEDYSRADADEASWNVFDSQGRWLGTVSLPLHLQVYEIGAHYVLAKFTDPFGVESVQVHQLVRGRN